MIFGEGVFGLLLLGFWIWAIFDVITTDEAMVRNLPKFVWLLLVIILSEIGALAWLLLGRPVHAGVRPGGDPTPPPRYVAPEDDVRWSTDHARREHYAAMDEELDRRIEEKRLQEWEAELRRREAALEGQERNVTDVDAEPPASS